MILCVSTFFIGLGGLIESVSARFKSDERALEIMRLARQAIGGEDNIKAMQSLTITGKASKTFEFDDVARVERGEWELNLQLPNKLNKLLKIETENNVGSTNSQQTFEKKVDVVIVRKGDGTETVTGSTDSPRTVTIVKKGEGGNVITEDEVNTSGQVRRVAVNENSSANAENFHRNELFRTMISLFLTPPQGTDAEYIYAGEQNVDGTNCEIVQVNSNGASVKLFLNKSSHIPVMMSYTDMKPFVFRINPSETSTDTNQRQTVTLNKVEMQTGEFQIKFSDYRSAGGFQLPFKWTQTIDGKADETIEVSAYEINPANIADKFQRLPQKVTITTEKPNQ